MQCLDVGLTCVCGVFGGSRIDMVMVMSTTAEHLHAYRRMDISLDTFPYAGTTTTVEVCPYMGSTTAPYCPTPAVLPQYYSVPDPRELVLCYGTVPQMSSTKIGCAATNRLSSWACLSSS